MSLPSHYRNAVACRTCAQRGDSLLNGMYFCRLHGVKIMGYGTCDDYQTHEENRRP